MNRFDFHSAPISPARYEGPLPSPLAIPEPVVARWFVIAAQLVAVAVPVALAWAVFS